MYAFGCTVRQHQEPPAACPFARAAHRESNESAQLRSRRRPLLLGARPRLQRAGILQERVQAGSASGGRPHTRRGDPDRRIRLELVSSRQWRSGRHLPPDPLSHMQARIPQQRAEGTRLGSRRPPHGPQNTGDKLRAFSMLNARLLHPLVGRPRDFDDPPRHEPACALSARHWLQLCSSTVALKCLKDGRVSRSGISCSPIFFTTGPLRYCANASSEANSA